MSTDVFLAHILPKQGNKIIALQKSYVRDGKVLRGQKYHKFPSASAMADAATDYDSDGEVVYYAINSYGDWYVDEKGKNRLRTQDNVVACKSIYDDYDTDPDKPNAYDSKADALADAIRFAKEVKLSPTIVDSGGGIHQYFTCTDDITPEQWLSLSKLKRDVTHHLGLKVDRAVDMDSARVLRPVGTHNRKEKYGEAEVKLLKLGKQYEYEYLEAVFSMYIANNNVEPAPANRKRKGTNPFAEALGDYPPSDADLVADHCAMIGKFRETGGESETIWYNAIGVVKHCTDGEAKCHEWSAKYSGYDRDETQTKIDQWQYGPTSCDKFDSENDCKKNCPFADKITFPIQLGHPEELEPKSEVSEQPAAAPTGTTIEGRQFSHWPKGWDWNGSVLRRSYQDDEGVNHWRPVASSLVIPVNRVRDSEGVWNIEFLALEKNGDWRTFYMPTLELASTDMMAKTLAAHEVFLIRNKTSRNDMADYNSSFIERLQQHRVETKTYDQFGWTDSYKGFVIGETMITEDDEKFVLCSDDIMHRMAAPYNSKGELQDWINNIDLIANREGAEVIQFALCHSFASPLIQIVGSSNWHGIPMVLSGFNGTGKSTIAKLALGIFGEPDNLQVQATDTGATVNSIVGVTSNTGDVPFLLDEFSNRMPDDLMAIGYALGNGRGKARKGPTGKWATEGKSWKKNSFVTSNDSILEEIGSMPATFKAEATQMRFFEFNIPEDFKDTVFPDIGHTFIDNVVDNMYGTAGRVYLRYIMKHMEFVRRRLSAAREKFHAKDKEENRERFYRDAVMTAMVAGKLAKKLGLIKFDLDRLETWAMEHIVSLRDDREEHNYKPEDQIAEFIASLEGQILVTRKFGKKGVKEEPIYFLRGPIKARLALDDKKFFVATTALNDWCRENRVKPASIKRELAQKRLLLKTRDGKPSDIWRMTQGTNKVAAPTRCYEFDFKKLMGQSETLKELSNPNPEEKLNGD